MKGADMKLPFFKKKEPRDETAAMLEKYRQAAEQNPQDPRPRTKMAELLLAAGRKAEAIEAYCAAAKAYDATGKTKIVTAIYKHVLSLDPGRVEVYQLLTDAFLKDYLVGDAVETMISLATYYYNHDRHYEAAQTIKGITAIDPNNTFYKTKVERFFKERNLAPEAIEKIGPKDRWTLVQATTAAPQPPAETSGGFFDLERVLDESSINVAVPDREPADDGGHASPDDVLAQISAMVGGDVEHGTPEFYYALGQAFMQRGEYAPACDEFRKATAGPAVRVEAYRNLIACCRRLERYDEAMRVVDEALKLKGIAETDRMDFLYEQALVCKSRGDRKQALKIFKKIHERQKDYKTVAREIAELSS